jgi:hypothetical protein
MYVADNLDIVHEMRNVSKPATGAPCPLVYSGEGILLLAYYTHAVPFAEEARSGNKDKPSANEAVALISFKSPFAHHLGPPNDEALSGHPLASRGLQTH